MQQPVALRGLVLPSGTLIRCITEDVEPYVVWRTAEDVEPYVLIVWVAAWRRRYAFERRELAAYEQPDLGGEG